MSIFLSLFLGLIQGIAEFFPISSSGHLAILQSIFSMDYPGDSHLLFDVLLHLGTLTSIMVAYWKEIKAMVSDGVEFLRARADSDSDEPVVLKPSGRALLFVIVGTVPMVLPLIFSNSIERLFSHVGFIGFALIITGGILFVTDRYVKKGNKTDKTMTLADALIIGLSQAVAAIPGLSRSGTTIAVGMVRGLSGSFAVRFSLLLSIPAVVGATIVELYKAIRAGIDLALFPAYLAGAIVAAAVGYFTIQIIRRLINKGVFGRFAYYCWGVGALTLILSLFIK